MTPVTFYRFYFNTPVFSATTSSGLRNRVVLTIGAQYAGLDVARYDLRMVLSKPGKYCVVEFKKEEVTDFAVVEDNACGVVQVPTEVKLRIPDMFGPESHCLMGVAVSMRYPSPVCVIALAGTGVVRGDGHLFITHKDDANAPPVEDEAYFPESVDLPPDTSVSAPPFRTSN